MEEKVIQISGSITVDELANALGVSVTHLIGELFRYSVILSDEREAQTEDVFINQVEFILRARKSVLDADERTKEALIGYIESVIHDLEELKGRF